VTRDMVDECFVLSLDAVWICRGFVREVRFSDFGGCVPLVQNEPEWLV
jgi:hypothetical protein